MVRITCSTCNGNGKYSVEREYTCLKCSGTGYFLDTNSLIYPYSPCDNGCSNGKKYETVYISCSPCGGKGYIEW